MRANGRGSGAAAVVLLALVLVAGCGGSEGKVGSLVPPTSAPAVTAAGERAGPAVTATDQAAQGTGKSPRVAGSGTYVYETGDLRVTLVIPASGDQDDVAQLRSFLRRTGSPSLQIASVTVRNGSGHDFSARGFRVEGEPGDVDLYPVSSFISLAMAQPVAVNNQEVSMAGTVASLTSVVTVKAGKTSTTLVATGQPVSSITRIEYTPKGKQPVEVRPLWQVTAEAAKAAHQQAREAAALARRAARLAREAAARAARDERRRHGGGSGHG